MVPSGTFCTQNQVLSSTDSAADANAETHFDGYHHPHDASLHHVQHQWTVLILLSHIIANSRHTPRDSHSLYRLFAQHHGSTLSVFTAAHSHIDTLSVFTPARINTNTNSRQHAFTPAHHHTSIQTTPDALRVTSLAFRAILLLEIGISLQPLSHSLLNSLRAIHCSSSTRQSSLRVIHRSTADDTPIQPSSHPLLDFNTPIQPSSHPLLEVDTHSASSHPLLESVVRVIHRSKPSKRILYILLGINTHHPAANTLFQPASPLIARYRHPNAQPIRSARLSCKSTGLLLPVATPPIQPPSFYIAR